MSKVSILLCAHNAEAYIAEAVESIGFRTRGVRTSVRELVAERPLPCIIHWNRNHFVVLYDIRKNHRTGIHTFYVADPASQLVRYWEEEFMRCWCSTTSARVGHPTFQPERSGTEQHHPAHPGNAGNQAEQL